MNLFLAWEERRAGMTDVTPRECLADCATFGKRNHHNELQDRLAIDGQRLVAPLLYRGHRGFSERGVAIDDGHMVNRAIFFQRDVEDGVS